MGAQETVDDSVFDAFVQAALEGELPDVEDFCGKRGAVPDDVRRRLEELRDLFAASEAGGVDPTRDRIGDFRLLRVLGEGSIGRVFLAEDDERRRLVALKVVHARSLHTDRARERFGREARAIANVRHRGLATIHAVGEADGVPWYAMELLSGSSLDDWIDSKSAPLRTAVGWIADVAGALAAAHEAGVVHRDVRPSNVRVTEQGRAVLVDFGLAPPGEAIGVAYASPEQLDARQDWVGPATDVFSLGATLYHAATGKRPFPGASREEVAQHVTKRDPRRPRVVDPAVPLDLEAVILKAMERDRARRSASARELERDLRAVLDLRPIAARVVSAPAREPTASRALALSHWARGHRRAAVAAGAAALGALALALLLLVQGVRERGARRREVEASLVEARELAGELRRQVALRHALAAEVLPLRQAARGRWMEPAEARRLEEIERELERLGPAADEGFFRALQLASRAERLAPGRPETLLVRSELYFERWRAALEAGDRARARIFRRLVEENDAERRYAGELEPRGSLALASAETGAEVFLFRYLAHTELAPDGERRLVPVPIGSGGPAGAREPLVAPGTWALRVTKPAGDLVPGDLIVELEGHALRGLVLAMEDSDPVRALDRLVEVEGREVRGARDLAGYALGAPRISVERDGARLELDAARVPLQRVFRDPDQLVGSRALRARATVGGALVETELATGLRARATAAPLELSAASRAGVTPLSGLALEPGSYLALLRRAEGELLRVPLAVESGRTVSRSVELAPLGDSPDGFVFVPGSEFVAGDGAGPGQSASTEDFWIMELEVTGADYQLFLNDAETQREIRASRAPIRYPRDPSDPQPGGLWGRYRRGDGTVAIPAAVGAAAAGGVSWDDARAFVRWINRIAKRRADRFEYALPTEAEWELAARGVDGRAHVFGAAFAPHWTDGRFGTPEAGAAKPPGRFPIDESVFGVFDLSGGVSEWCATADGGRVLRGASAGTFRSEDFRATARFEPPAAGVATTSGIRLVAHLRFR